MPADFAQQFCRRFDVLPKDYRTALLNRSLYPAARVVRPLLQLVHPDHFSADLEFVDNIGSLTRWKDFLVEAQEFNHHPANRSFLRYSLRLRISVGRMHALFREVMEPDDRPGDSPAAD